MNHITRNLIFFTLACIIFAACGQHALHNGGAGGSPVRPTSPTTIQDALAELDALEKPEGVDAKLWEGLKGALRGALECKVLNVGNGNGELQFATPLKVSRSGDRESRQ